MNDAEQAAHRYAEIGWNVFPCAPDSKLPLTQHGFLDASSSHRRIEGWWGTHPAANVAIATGRPGPDVLDIDVHKDGSGWAALNELKRAGLVPDAGAVVKTPSGGGHYYYAGTDQRNGHLSGHHLDFRALGGYVVAPPSQVDGRPYVVVKHQPAGATFNWQAVRDHLSPSPQPKPAPPLMHRSLCQVEHGTCDIWCPGLRHSRKATATRACSGQRPGQSTRETPPPSGSWRRLLKVSAWNAVKSTGLSGPHSGPRCRSANSTLCMKGKRRSRALLNVPRQYRPGMNRRKKERQKQDEFRGF